MWWKRYPLGHTAAEHLAGRWSRTERRAVGQTSTSQLPCLVQRR